MIEGLALAAVLLAAAWLAIAAIIMLLAPRRARQALAAMGSSWSIQLGEHIPRALVGGAMVVRAPLSKAPLIFEVAGWFVLASSVLILVLPRRWHHAYALFWAERIALRTYRWLSLPTFLAAGALAYGAISPAQ